MGVGEISSNNVTVTGSGLWAGKTNFVGVNASNKAHKAANAFTVTQNGETVPGNGVYTWTLTVPFKTDSGFVAPVEGVITLTPATKVVVSTDLTMTYKYMDGTTGIAPAADLTAGTYYVAEGAVVTVKGATAGDRIDVTTGANGTPVPGTPTAAAPSVEKTVGTEELKFDLVKKIAAVEVGAISNGPAVGSEPNPSMAIALGTLDPVNSVDGTKTVIAADASNTALDSSGNYVTGTYKFTVTMEAASGYYFGSVPTVAIAGANQSDYSIEANSAEVTNGKLSFVISIEIS